MSSGASSSFTLTSIRYAALALMLAGLPACEAARAEKGGTGDAPGALAVRFGGKGLTLSEIDAPIALDLFELRSETARRLTLAVLLREEANRRGISVEELRRREVDEKLAPPSKADLRNLYAAEVEQVHGAAPSYEELEPKLIEMAQGGQRQAGLQRFLTELMSRAKVRMNFDAMGRPKFRTRPGGAEIGPSAAPITIVEYADFESPFCAQAEPTIERLHREFPTQVRILFREAPQPEHANAEGAAIAALCADDQGRYLDFRKALFSEQKSLGKEKSVEIAGRLGLDAGRFSECVASGLKTNIIRGDVEEARAAGLEGSPVFSVNGARLSGAHSFDVFRELITLELP